MTEGFQGGTPGNGHDGDRPLERLIHPGSGRRKAPKTPKGRQVEPETLAEVHALLGDRPRNRDLLIEFLHLLQDRYGHLSARHMAALAQEMKLAMAEVYEVASFYAHFDIVTEHETPPPPLTVRVCDSLSCEMQGAQALLAALPGVLGSQVRVLRAPCVGRCEHAPVAEVGHRHIDEATVDSIKTAVEKRDTHALMPAYKDFAAYIADGGYQLLKACLAGQRQPEELFKTLEDSGLRGLGGAGFPAGRKWRIVSQQPAPRLLTVNADEGEPGTFKDRVYLEQDPHRIIEGALIAAWAAGGCERGYI
jgi:formate dehydrogenase